MGTEIEHGPYVMPVGGSSAMLHAICPCGWAARQAVLTMLEAYNDAADHWDATRSLG